MKNLVLASTSPFRRELLSRLGLPFTVQPPNIEELFKQGEPPHQAAERLAAEKARAVSARLSGDAIVIASDQIATDGNQIYGKPGNLDKARDQLQSMRGKEIIFYTGICVLDTKTNVAHCDHAINQVGFRHYSDTEIESYLAHEDVLSCAGSAKSEGLGISMLTYIRGDDPNALIGLPLIKLCSMLRACSVDIP